ncbi:MAG: radical SAM protein [Patescibacteria group bacterium]|nr:radical SAM protein [Patescibacteria group bacterium]
MNDLNKYNEIPLLAKWKALLLEYGVDLNDLYLFNNYKDIELYKIKYRILNPVTKNLEVYDESEDNSIIPSEIIIKNGKESSIAKLRYRNDSPIVLDTDNKIFFLKIKSSGKKIPLKITLVKKRNYQKQTLPKKINKNCPKIADFIDFVGLDRMSVIFFDGCWNWNCNKACSFCDLNPKRKNYSSAKPTLNTLSDYDFNIDKWWQYYKKEYLEGLSYTFDYLLKTEEILPHKHLLLMCGNLSSSKKVWDISIEIIDTLNKVSDINKMDNYLNVCPHPNIKYLKKVKEKGIKSVQYNLEVIGEKDFKKFCPGKINYNLFISKLEEAVSIMGFGNVRSNFVIGIQPTDKLLAGIKELAKKGIVADYSIFQPKRSTPLENHPAPDMDVIVCFTKELVKIYKQYDFKGIYCRLSSRSSIINECL